MIKGGCACGRIQYQTQAQPIDINACHCITCQIVSGGPFLGFAAFRTEDLNWTQQPDVWQGSDIATRGHCKVCGSTMSMQYLFELDRMFVTLGTVSSADPALPLVHAHIFLKDKAPYIVVPDDGARRHEGFSAAFQDRIDQWNVSQQKGQ